MGGSGRVANGARIRLLLLGDNKLLRNSGWATVYATTLHSGVALVKRKFGGDSRSEIALSKDYATGSLPRCGPTWSNELNFGLLAVFSHKKYDD